MTLLYLLVASLSVSLVAGHGYVQEQTVGGITYSGFLPWSDPYYPVTPSRIIRKIPGNFPIEDLSLIDIQCNGRTEEGYAGSAPAPLIAPATAGSTVTFNWTTWPDSHLGPIITYMAKAPAGVDITSWMPGTDAVWFKIDESGKSPEGVWATKGIMTNDSIYSVTIPEDLMPGQYIMRHEIIALHGAFNFPGVQVYPSCSQIEIQGSGTRFPPPELLVSFPGAYTGDTPGIHFNIYGTDSTPYPIPGPPVWS